MRDAYYNIYVEESLSALEDRAPIGGTEPIRIRSTAIPTSSENEPIQVAAPTSIGHYAKQYRSLHRPI